MSCQENQCEIGKVSLEKTSQSTGDNAIIYVGDPMCSWCWGFAPALQALREEAMRQNMPFLIVLGGLRAGGADAWTAEFRQFLRHHWQEVAQRSNQDFSFDLLSRPQFDYNTEPACRAVVVFRDIFIKNNRLPELYDVFHAIQQRFYVDNQDPNQLAFYQPICENYQVDFQTFSQLFHSEKSQRETAEDFALCRRWQVRAFPTVLLRQNQHLQILSAGFCTATELLAAFAAQYS